MSLPMRTPEFLTMQSVTAYFRDLCLQRIDSLLAEPLPCDPVSMLRLEELFLAAGRHIADLLTAAALFQVHLDPRFCKQAISEARRVREPQVELPLKSKGRPQRLVQLRGGLVLPIKTPYLSPDRADCPGRPRGWGKRGPEGVGALPVLEALGITYGVTPATRSEISRQLVVCSSYKECLEHLKREGLEIDSMTMVNVALDTGNKAIELRDLRLAKARSEPLGEDSLVAGQRVRISTDGGRAQTRRTLRGPGYRPGANGRRPIETSWREPRIITIDLLDESGEVLSTFKPIYEVTLGNADEVFNILTGLLRLIGIHKAKEVLLISDGADWIWDRWDLLIKECELEAKKVHRVLDFYHAAEHVSEALKACKSLDQEAREKLCGSLRSKLKDVGGPEAVIAELRGLAQGRQAEEVGKEIKHLEKHLEHMNYAGLRALNLPIGSGVVESAVRRVINLRFKSAGQFWLEENLGPLMYLRAIVKSGRWESFMVSWLEGRHWLERGGDFNGRVPVTSSREAA